MMMSDVTDEGEFLSSRTRVHSTGQLRYHNEMLAQRPDLVEELYTDCYRSRLGEESGDNAAFYALPIFGMEKGSFTCQMGPGKRFHQAGTPRPLSDGNRFSVLLHCWVEGVCFLYILL